ncbi:RNA 2',3'-cyclic phosphodiesterase [Maribellus comscasis]|uniref:RNA 2',3'-cyclic phosphodiesterase n=1 Tax=Maribellus comscasis TaxID=2681766 RepID=A0A6I6K5H7_9BACT|nr:RNA 2',3'-cyclic phosphodiesterase [Maribellus comscasis]QGY45254.1 RNA 2',3'-cyclic phosphodiesterase [Maribellus comscasis]
MNSSSNIRTFIAVKIKPEPELVNLLHNCRDVFEGEAIKWVEENNLHLTLKFLGETSPAQIQEVKNCIENSGAKYSSFVFQLNGLGYFESKGQPRVLFSGIRNFEQMKLFVADLEACLNNLGFEKENREFKPHLTIGRIKFLKDKRRFYRFVEEYKNQTFQIITVTGIVFYQSILKTNRPQYIPLHVVQLNS